MRADHSRCGFSPHRAINAPAADVLSPQRRTRGPTAVYGLVYWYSKCRSGAVGALPSNASAVRCPLPVMMKAIALPLAQPGRLTTCCITAARLGVRWFAPSWLALQAAGDHCTEALVRGREETLKLAVVKVAACRRPEP
jgi:hypothetical protein